VEFALLGPLEVRRGGELVAVRRGRPRTLLISLLLRLGRAVPADVLIDQVWGERPPSDPVNALQVQVSYLRRALGLASTGAAPCLRTEAGGYVLDVNADAVDVYRLERAVSSATERLAQQSREEVEAGLAELRAVLGLWRGEALQDVAYEPFAVPEVARLGELRAVALEHEIEAQLLLGRHEEAIPVLRRLIADHPLRERFRALLMVALYRSGRQAEALRAFDATRERLVEELGVEPGAELQALQRSVLAHDPGLDWTPLWSPAGHAVASEGAEAEGAGLEDGSLPAPTSGLVGREREVAGVHAALADNRMVTLTGPGGAGKTRLALAVAHNQARTQPVWFVDLGELGDPSLVPFEVARAVGATSLTDPLDAATVRIGDRLGLLLLDTCEHLIDACATTAHRLLRACPALGVLATSRQPLAVAGEVAWPVPPLGVPDPAASPPELRQSEAVRLFCERSRAVRPDVVLDESVLGDVARICQTLDGLPLAIELAAARTNVLSVAGILERLGDRFALLRKVGRAAEVRQQSLRGAIDWSHDLLDDDQRRFFDRLGVFAGRFTLDAATAVAAHGLGTDPLELLSAVVDRSLVVADRDDSYRMLDSLRTYAVECLHLQPAEWNPTHARLAAWLTDYCEAVAPRLCDGGQESAMARLRAEVPNIRATLEWAFASGDAVAGAQLTSSLTWYWALEPSSEEAIRWLGPALERAGTGETRARLLEGLGIHLLMLGDLAATKQTLVTADQLWTELGTPERGLKGLSCLGEAECWLGDLDAAAATHDRAIALARSHGDDWHLAWSLGWRVRTAAEQGDEAVAAALLAEALGLAERVGDPRVLGWIVYELAAAALRNDDYERAFRLAGKAADIHAEIGWREGLAAALAAVGRALVGLGRPTEAIAYHHRALGMATELRQPYAICDALEGLADALASADKQEPAAEVLGCAAATRARMGVRASYAEIHRGRVVEALEEALRQRLGDRTFVAAFGRGEHLAPSEVTTGLSS
jgi:predicted ATPase/DNA-binding SARP family transcriptional activator